MPLPVEELKAVTGCYFCLLGFNCKVPDCLACQGSSNCFGCCREQYRCGCPNKLGCHRQDQCFCCDTRCGFGDVVPPIIGVLGLVCMNCGKSKDAKLEGKTAQINASSAKSGGPQLTAEEVKARMKRSDQIEPIDVNDLCCKTACLCCVEGFFFKMPMCCGCSGSGGCCGCCEETYVCTLPSKCHCYSAHSVCCIDYRVGCCGGTIPRLLTCCGATLFAVKQDDPPATTDDAGVDKYAAVQKDEAVHDDAAAEKASDASATSTSVGAEIAQSLDSDADEAPMPRGPSVDRETSKTPTTAPASAPPAAADGQGTLISLITCVNPFDQCTSSAVSSTGTGATLGETSQQQARRPPPPPRN